MHDCTRITAAALLFLSGSAMAQQDAPAEVPAGAVQPAPTTPDAAPDATAVAQENPGIVVSVSGIARVRVSEEGGWESPAIGRVLPVGTRIRTGPGGSITIRVGENQLFTFDGVAQATLSEAVRAQNLASVGEEASEADVTRIDVGHGRVLFDVTKTTVANDVSIQTPDSTLDVSGTQGAIIVSGRDVSAFGAEGNTGRFTVRYPSGKKATIEDNSETSSDAPSPAEKASQTASATTGAPRAREEGENQAGNRGPGGGEPIKQSTGLTGPPPPAGSNPNQNLEDNVGGDVDDLPQVPGSGGGGGGGNGGGGNGGGGGMDPDDGGGGMDPDDGGGGMDPDGGGGMDPMGGPLGNLLGVNFVRRSLFSLDGSPPVANDIIENVGTIQTPAGGVAARALSSTDVEVFVLSSNFNFTNPGGGTLPTPQNFLSRAVVSTDGEVVEPFNLQAIFTNNFEKPQLYGLATFGNDLYAVGIELEALVANADPTILVRLDPQTEQIERVASFGGFIEAGLTSSNQQGRLFMLVSVDSEFSTTQDFLFQDLAIIAFDPRTRMITQGSFGGMGAFEPVAGAMIDPQIGLDPLMRIDDDTSTNGTGLGVALLGSDLYVVVDLEDVNGVLTQSLIRIDLSANTDPSTPRLLSLEIVDNGLGFDVPVGLSNINGGMLGAPRAPMSNPGPMGIDRNTIDPLFADVSYTQQALDSGAVEALFLDAFLRTAQDPIGCASSNLMSMVGPALQARVEQTHGIGRASFDLRDGLDTDHPCSSVLGAPGPEIQ